MLVGVSTMLTRQHYILDVVAGIALACIAYLVFLRNVHPEAAQQDRQVVTTLAVGLLGFVAAGVAGAWAFHQWGVG